MAKTKGHLGFSFETNHLSLIALFIAIGVVLFLMMWPQTAASNKTLAQCLTEKGVVMYGVDTCTHCQDQKELFGKDFLNVKYINCDFNKKMCENKGITFYPVWSHENSVLVGTQSLQSLAEFAGCVK